jgi:hypothetical protein
MGLKKKRENCDDFAVVNKDLPQCSDEYDAPDMPKECVAASI